VPLGVWETLFLVSVAGVLLAIPFEKTRRGKDVGMAFGILMLSLVAWRGLDGYVRGHWRFNSLLVPEAVLGPDGNYTDGTPAGGIERAWQRSSRGAGAVVTWTGYACMGWSAWTLWGAWRNDRRRNRRRHAMAEPGWRR
jgi:hypothetical protein